MDNERFMIICKHNQNHKHPYKRGEIHEERSFTSSMPTNEVFSP
jgi:hypothetical protein